MVLRYSLREAARVACEILNAVVMPAIPGRHKNWPMPRSYGAAKPE